MPVKKNSIGGFVKEISFLSFFTDFTPHFRCFCLLTFHRKTAWEYPEMQKYISVHSKGAATECINAFIERNADQIQDVKKLISYMAERPGVEKLGKHGLFSQTDDKIVLDKVSDEVANHKGVIWTHVISLTREDAELLGYNKAAAWRELVRRNAMQIAEAHKIPISEMK